MNFIVSSSVLNEHLQAIGRVIGSKSSISILECFLFEAENDTLTVTASDTETTLITKVPVTDLDEKGKFAITAKTLLDAMKEIPEQPISFKVDTTTLSLEIGYQNGVYKFMAQNADEYPKSAEMNSPSIVKFNIAADNLLSGITKTIFATANDELRHVMNGIYFDIDSEKITLVASDGHKLVRCIYPEYKGFEKSAFSLPQKPANLLKNILGKESGDVSVQFDDKNALFLLENYSIMCRLIEGHFPNYNAVIPTDNPFCATIDRQQMICALRRVLIFSEKTSSLIKLEFGNDSVNISGQDYDFSTSAEEKLPCSYTDNPLSIGFKGTLLREILDNMDGQDILFQLNNPSRPGIIVPAEQNEKEQVLMLLMPMMLND